MSRILRHVGNKDFKRTRQRQVDEQKESAALKMKEWQEAEAERRQIEEISRPFKSDWRKETQLQESDWTPVAGSIANSTGTTFVYTGDNTTLLHVTGLGGVEGTPKTATIDCGFGDTLEVPAPDFSQLGLQGYAPPLANIQRKTDQEEDERIDAEIRKLQEQIKQLDQKISNLSSEQKEFEPEYTGMTYDQYFDRKKEINKKWTEKTQHLGQIMMRSDSVSEVNAARDKYYEYNDARTEELNALDAEYKSQSDSHLKKVEDHYNAYSKKFDSLRKEQNALNIQIVKLEKQRPINKQLDASQEAYPYLPLMNARVQSAAGASPTTFTSGRGAGRSSFTSGDADGNVLIPVDPRTGARGSANSFGQRGSDGGRPDMPGAAQQAYPTAVRTGQGGRPLGSTTQRQGGAINPSTPARSATGISFSDLASAANQVRQDNLARNGEAPINPNVLGRLARSATDSTRYSGNMMFQGNPAGRAPGLSNFWSPDPAAAGTYSNPGRAKGIPGTRPNPTGTLTTAPRPRNVPRVTRGLTGTPQFKFPKGQVPPSNMFTQTADDAAVKAAQNAAQKAGGKTLSKFLARAIPFANAALAGADAGNRVRQGDYFGAALGAATAIPGPLGWTALGAQMGYDAIGRPFMGAPATTPTSGRGAGRSSFPTSDGNVVPRSNSANANSVGQRGSDGGMTDAQIKAAQDKANAARRAGKMSDIRGSQANKGFAPDPKTGEPRYTGMNDRQYSDATNKIADKYNKLRAPIERQYAELAGEVAPMSLMNKLNALNDKQTAEEEALAAKRAAQENAFNDALQDYNDKQDAANQARQDALDEIDNEEDPYSKLLAELGAKMEKLRREGKSVKKVEIIGPGEEGYVDTTNMANAIGYNRRIIYTAAAKELQKQILAAQDAQMAWMNDRDKRREDAEKADYSDAGGSSGQGRRKGGQGGLPLGTTSLRSGGARQPTPPENMSQSAALARQAAFARANPQQRRKNNKKYSTFSTEETTWSRLKKYR